MKDIFAIINNKTLWLCPCVAGIYKREREIKNSVFKSFINRNKWDGQLSITETNTSGQQLERQEALFEVAVLVCGLVACGEAAYQTGRKPQ